MPAGRPKNIKSPNQLWELFLAYKAEVKKRPRRRQLMNQRTGRMVWEKLETPLTKEGFYNFVADQGIMSTLRDYFSNKDDAYKEFLPIITRIGDQIRQDQIEGGMVGQYNSSLTARINGLSDRQELTGANGEAIKIEQITGMEVI